MTIVLNRRACSAEFLAAFDVLEAGKPVRRSIWPEGMALKRRDDGCIGVFRSGASLAPVWAGPSSAESDATDWRIL